MVWRKLKIMKLLEFFDFELKNSFSVLTIFTLAVAGQASKTAITPGARVTNGGWKERKKAVFKGGL